MLETNEEICEKLKQAILDYYMGYIKQKLRCLLVDEKESEISNHIMQFLDAQIDTGNPTILKEDIVKILNSILLEDSSNYSSFNLTNQNRISHCFPEISEISIESEGAVYLTEKLQTPFNGIEERSCFLYLSSQYYEKTIQEVENKIKQLEKNFSKQDLKGFQAKFEEHLSIKQYELESAKVYESAANQIQLKKQKYQQVSKKMIHEYGRKYKEILNQELPDEEKQKLMQALLEDTKSFDEKNHQAVARLNLEFEKLSQDFAGSVQSSDLIHKQMQNLHLFDKNRYFEDMMSATQPELRDLYQTRYLLNSYRIQHHQTVYQKNKNVVADFLDKVVHHIRYGKTPLLLGPHFERDYSKRCYS